MTKLVSQDEDLLAALKAATGDIGIDLNDAAMSLGLPPDLLANPHQIVPSQLFNCLLEAIANDYHCPDIALKVAENITEPTLGLPTRIMGLSPTLGDGLQKATQYSAFYRDTAHWQHQYGEHLVTLYKTTDPAYLQNFKQRNLLGIALFYRLLIEWSDSNWLPNKVSLTMADPGHNFSQTFEQFFATDIAFNNPLDGIHLPLNCINEKICTADDQVLQGVVAHINNLQHEINQGEDLIGRARLIVNQRLSFATCTLADLALYLAVEPETLTTELQEHGLTFEQLLEQQICEKAHYYLTEMHAPIELILAALMPNNEPRLNELLMSSLDAQPQW